MNCVPGAGTGKLNATPRSHAQPAFCAGLTVLGRLDCGEPRTSVRHFLVPWLGAGLGKAMAPVGAIGEKRLSVPHLSCWCRLSPGRDVVGRDLSPRLPAFAVRAFGGVT